MPSATVANFVRALVVFRRIDRRLLTTDFTDYTDEIHGIAHCHTPSRAKYLGLKLGRIGWVALAECDLENFVRALDVSRRIDPRLLTTDFTDHTDEV